MNPLRNAALALALLAASSSPVLAGAPAHGPMSFEPIAGSAYGMQNDPDVATAPWVVPRGYVQTIVSDETRLDIYTGNDWYDMNTVNESGPHAGRYLYRTHEVRPAADGHAGTAARKGGGSGGSVSVVDLETGAARVLASRADWEALDGIVWTSWQTLLFTEEAHASMRPDPDVPNARSGLVYELRFAPGDPMRAEKVSVRPLLGALAHEGIEIDPEGNVYVIDEDRKGSLYKFVPQHPGDLSSGRLHALRVKGGAKTGAAEWVALDAGQVQVSAREAAAAVGATPYCRPEDIERIGGTLYVALTCEDVDDPANTRGRNAAGYAVGAVLAVELGKRPAASFVVAAGKNVPFEVQPTATSEGVTGFARVDNLANGPDGTLWMVEDNDFSDIWVYDPAAADVDGDGYRDGMTLFASLKDRQAEGSGIYFGKDPHTLFVNVQHSGSGSDKTVAITRQQK